jgi:hypothetical protein
MQEGLDLFGQVVVSWPEVIEWCQLVAGISPDSPRLAAYVTAWDVPAKVAQAKLAGTWPPPAGRSAAASPPTGRT